MKVARSSKFLNFRSKWSIVAFHFHKIYNIIYIKTNRYKNKNNQKNCLCACTTNSLKIPAQHAKYVAKQRVQNDFHKNLPSASINNIGIRMGKWLGLFRSEAKLSQMELHIKTQKPQKVSTQHIVTY